MREFKIELKFIKSDSNTKEVCYTQNKITLVIIRVENVVITVVVRVC